MNDSKISMRYAKALYLAAADLKAEDAIRTDMETILELMAGVPEFNVFLSNPVMASAVKLDILKNVLYDKIHELSQQFLSLIINSKRESFLKIMALNYVKLYLERKGIKHAEITTVYPLEKQTIAQLQQTLGTYLNSDVEISEKTNAKLIGGFVLKVDDLQFDASVASKLAQIKQNLIIK